jgi:sRNA-binding regulator protein Hfq
MKTDIENVKEHNKEPKKEPKKEQKKEKKITYKEHPSVIKNFIGKEIAITLRNSNKIKGKLETVAQYELVITTEYNPIIVMKHAIDYIELSGEK